MTVIATSSPKISLHQGGRRLEHIERLELTKNGGKLLTNSELDRIANCEAGRLNGDVFREMVVKKLSTRTLLAKLSDCKDGFGEKISDKDTHITLIVPKVFQGIAGYFLAADLTRENFEITRMPGQLRATVEVKEEDLRLIRAVAGFSWGKASEGTLFIPSVEMPGQCNMDRFLAVNRQENVGLISRDQNMVGVKRNAFFYQYAPPGGGFAVPVFE
jgi:hypothetical protein